ncbi:MAG: hypothetical protein ACLT8E_08520 [Akkermansia sp.]
MREASSVEGGLEETGEGGFQCREGGFEETAAKRIPAPEGDLADRREGASASKAVSRRPPREASSAVKVALAETAGRRIQRREGGFEETAREASSVVKALGGDRREGGFQRRALGGDRREGGFNVAKAALRDRRRRF